ncbi:MAG: class I SAM-dependent methyltransferase [Candidatus Hydrogenedentota bacterium]|nr:MAG: class I SAM-dependent methyltransferase [Candidatus Hydrogenedentota bacterium]
MSSNRKLYKWFYDNIGSRYYNVLVKWCFLPFGGEEKVRRKMLDAVPFEPGERILDMCCGTGNATFVIAEKVGEQSRIKAIDLSSGQIRVAKRRNRFSNVEFMVMDASNTSFGEGDFDKVVIPHALHEMPRTTRFAVLKEARRVLAEEGTLAVLEMDDPPSLLLRLFIGLWWFYWLPFNFETPTRRDMLRHGLSEEVMDAGFDDVSRSSLCNGVLQVVQGRKQMARQIS